MNPLNKFLHKYNPVFIQKDWGGGVKVSTNTLRALDMPGVYRRTYIDKTRARALVKPGLIAAGALGAAGLAAALPSIIRAVKRKRQLKRLSKNV